MKIGPWVARKRKAFWGARFAVAVANCNASVISALSISLIEPSLEILVAFVTLEIRTQFNQKASCLTVSRVKGTSARQPRAAAPASALPAAVCARASLARRRARRAAPRARPPRPGRATELQVASAARAATPEGVPAEVPKAAGDPARDGASWPHAQPDCPARMHTASRRTGPPGICLGTRVPGAPWGYILLQLV
jgi:hypothetical protein